MAPYFAEMLSALPPAVDIFEGDGEGWVKSTPAQVAAHTQVKNYAPRIFSDVAGTNYELAANTLCTYGMLRGYADGTFHPDNGLTRAELCALLTQTMRLRLPETGATFSDVAKDSWYAPYIQAAQAAGYASGVGNGRFDPRAR
ncbi:MAG: S-layer homology domain-containing protein [Evtepia sp.]